MVGLSGSAVDVVPPEPEPELEPELDDELELELADVLEEADDEARLALEPDDPEPPVDDALALVALAVVDPPVELVLDVPLDPEHAGSTHAMASSIVFFTGHLGDETAR